MPKHLPNCRLRGEIVEGAQGVRLAVLDELIRPADAFNGGVDTGDVQLLDDRRAEAVHQDVVLESANDAALAGVLLDDGGVQRLDETRIDECH